MSRTASRATRAPGRGRAVLAALVTMVFGLAVTMVTTAWVRDNARRDAEEQFRQSAGQTARSIEQELSRSFDKLRDIGAFAANAPGVPAEQFQRYVRDTGIFDRLPSLVGVFFVQRVEEADLPAFMASFTADHPGFAVAEIGSHDPGAPYYLLTYYVPGKVDLGLPIGTNVSAIPSVVALMEEGAGQGKGVAGSFQDDPLIRQLAAQNSFPLVDNLMQLDFFAGLPVQEAPGTYGIDPASTGSSLGWVGATVDDFGQIAAAATRDQPDDLGLALTVDLSSAGMEERTDISRVAEQAGNAGPRGEAAFTTTESFEVEGISWRVDLWSDARAGEPPATVRIVFIGGIVATVFAAALVYLRVRSHDREREYTVLVADREQFQRDILDSVTAPMVVLDGDGRIVRANPAWTDLRLAAVGPDGAADEARGTYVEVIGGALRAGAAELGETIARALRRGGEAADVDVAIDTAGRRRWFGVRATPLRGPSGGAVVVHTDITERKRSQEELELKATRDNLTGLLNRLAFEDEVDAAIRAARTDGSAVAALFIDLDGFKPINDTFGHAVGDDVLRTVARRLTGAVRTSDRVARLGGDEFVVLIHPLPDAMVAEATAERILDALRRPARVGEREIPLAASIGVALVDPAEDGSHENLIHRADEAMYAAKQQGGGRTTIAR